VIDGTRYIPIASNGPVQAETPKRSRKVPRFAYVAQPGVANEVREMPAGVGSRGFKAVQQLRQQEAQSQANTCRPPPVCDMQFAAGTQDAPSFL
jgi:hypothetical protein